MSRRKLLDFDPEQIVVELARRGRGDAIIAELLRRFDKAPFEQRHMLRERLAQAIALFEETRERNDRLLRRR